MKIWKNILCFFIVVACCGCQTTIDLSESYSTENRLVMNSVVTAGEPVRVSISRPIFLTNYVAMQPMEVVQDAEVVVAINGVPEVLSIDTTGEWFVSTSIPQIGDSVTLVANYDNDTLSASVLVPERVNLKVDTTCLSRNLIWVSDYVRDSAGNYIYGPDGDHLRDSMGNFMRDTAGWDMRPLYKVKVGFKDFYPQRDGYMATARHINEYADSTMAEGLTYPIAWQTYTTTTASNLILSYLNYNVTTSNFTSDYNLNGDSLTFTFSSNFFVNNTSTALGHQVNHVYLVVDVYHLSYDYYTFLATANLSSNYSGNTSVLSLIGEPQRTYCNVEGGLGFVGVQTLTSDTLMLY